MKRLGSLILGILILCLSAAPARAMEAAEAVIPVEVNGTAVVEIKPLDDAPAQTPETVTVTGQGTLRFSFAAPGTFWYEVRQLPGSEDGVIYDDTVWLVSCFVEVGSDGQSNVVTGVSRQGRDDKEAVVTFENKTGKSDDPDPDNPKPQDPDPKTPKPDDPDPDDPAPKPGDSGKSEDSGKSGDSGNTGKSGNTTRTGSTATQGAAPRTGDDSSVALWIGLSSAALILLIGMGKHAAHNQ